MPALQGQDKVENPVAIPAQCYLSIILGLHGCKAGLTDLHGCKAGLTDLGASASSLETDGLRGEGFRPSGTRPGAESPKQMVVDRSVKWRWCRALGSTTLRWAHRYVTTQETGRNL